MRFSERQRDKACCDDLAILPPLKLCMRLLQQPNHICVEAVQVHIGADLPCSCHTLRAYEQVIKYAKPLFMASLYM